MRILITGGTGMLGRAVCRRLETGYELIAPTRAELDITDETQVARYLRRTAPAWVLHMAAMTDVDRCQQEPDLAFRTNGQATAFLAAHCRRLGIGLLYTSSIAVFDGEKAAPYGESDVPRPVNVYGESKWRGERAVATVPRHLIVRSGWLFGGGAVDKKFVGKILALAQTRDRLYVVADKIGSPTAVTGLAAALAQLLQRGATGLYHVVNSGPPASRYDYACAVIAAAGLNVAVSAVTSDHFPQLAPRPALEAACSEKLPADHLPPWTQALDEYVKRSLERPQLLGYDRDLY